MEKRVLQTYSSWAKEHLENQIEVSLKALGIHSEQDIKSAKRAGEYTVIEGDPNSYPASLLGKRSQIVTLVRENGYQNVIEEFAYTWFNRFVALRFMEVHDFLPHGFRVLSNRSGGVEPEILKNYTLVARELKLDTALCSELKDAGKTEELYRYLLLQQCGALAEILPMLFSRESDYLELLLPKSLLIGDTVITRLLEIPEEAFLEDVEIIGWMYQFYISSKKDAVNKAKKTITKDTLPAVTQLFTPKWIVRYMAENSVGRIWLESNPASALRADMPYYVEEAEQTEEVQRQLDAIRYRNVDPKELRVIDPCCGSGHILVYVFDLLYRMYEEKGYSAREIPSLILKHNLVGLDVDKRAAQLSAFALVMKARRANSRFFHPDYYIAPQVIELRDSGYLEQLHYKARLTELKAFSEAEIKAVTKLVETFRYGKTIGSLIRVPELDTPAIDRVIHYLDHDVVSTIDNTEFVERGTKRLKALLAQARVLAGKYDVMITNPPYLGTSSMEPKVKEYASKHYPNSKADLFAMFMETGLVKPNGFTAMINMHSWMFLSTYEKLRSALLTTKSIITMAHLGARAFESIAGEVVQTTAFVLRSNNVCKYNGLFYRLVSLASQRQKESAFLSRDNCFVSMQNQFSKIPGMPIAYWISKTFLSLFDNETIGDIGYPKQGLSTADNDRFLRYWFEVSSISLSTNSATIEESIKSCATWFPFNKGGEYRKWYGNFDYVINWNNNGAELKSFPNAAIRNPEYYFQRHITWSKVSTGTIGFRIRPEGSVFSDAGCALLLNNKHIWYALGLLNSKLAQCIFDIINPTINYTQSTIANLPYIFNINQSESSIGLVHENITLSKLDWDAFETSWDFKYHPLVELRIGVAWEGQPFTFLISDAYDTWARICEDRFQQLKANEEELNRIFIDIYGLQDELTPEVKDEDVTVRLADKERDIKSLVSYLVGVVMGRYSLDVEGLAYAGGDWDSSKYVTYQPDDDGIVPIYMGLGMEDGLTARIIDLIKRIYGENSYRENIDFIAEALGKKSNESSEETLNRYLNDGFYANHLKIYQKRPIYWLFSSGKHSGFKCLIYMHRYDADTLARINGKYFLPESTRLKNELEELQQRINRAEGRERTRLEKERQKLSAAYNEALEYGQILDHMANRYIEIDLDDGVKVNYAKFQGVEIVTDSGTKVKKDLLAPIK